MTIILGGESFVVTDHPTMRYLKAMADAGEQPKEGDGIGMAIFAGRLVASFLNISPENMLDVDPAEVMQAFVALSNIQARVPFDASPAAAGAEPAASPQDSMPSPTASDKPTDGPSTTSAN